jgi:hypothetical protein
LQRKENKMAKLKKKQGYLHTLLRRGLLIITIVGLIGTILSLTSPTTWATPGQSPEKQTVPPPPPPPPPEEPEWPPPTPPPLPCEDCIRKKIGPEGGEIDLPTNRILVTVPPGCLTQEIEFTLCNFDCACECGPVEGKSFRLGDVCFTLEGWFVGGQKVTHDYRFACPIGITIGYTDANLAEVGGDPRNLGLAYCDETTGGWVPLDPILDEKNHNVSVPVDHLTWFALTYNLPVIELPQELPETGEEGTGRGWSLALLGVLLVLAGGLLSARARASRAL